MRVIEYFIIRFVLFLVCASLTFLPLVQAARYFDEGKLRAPTVILTVLALAYYFALAWFTKRIAHHMSFEDRKLGAATKFAFWDLRLRLGLLPLVGHWFMPQSDEGEEEDDEAPK